MSRLNSLVAFLLIICAILSCKAEDQQHEKSTSDTDSEEYHAHHVQDRSHLLAHISDRMDLDGEGLRHIKNHLGKMVGDIGGKDVEDIEKGDNSKASNTICSYEFMQHVVDLIPQKGPQNSAGIFYFFKLHDYDNNNKLDGLELLSALTDFHEDDDVQDHKEGGKNFAQEEAVKIADELLEKHDKNKDGMIDYPELMDSKVDSLMTDLDKDIEEPVNGTAEEAHS